MADSTLIQDRYRLLDLIGRGGMGEVWSSRDESLGRRVAVKCLKPAGSRSDQTYLRVLRERFRREARVAAGLQHRGVTVVHDFGEYDGLLYLVMELLDGRNLSQLLNDNQQRPLPVPDVLDIAEQIAAALAYTHDQSIVHRDLKPANVMRTRDGTVKICDFGIARLGHDIGFTAKLTGSHVAMGTPHYMSPEQISGSPVDHRSDLYSLGCVLYEIVTGVPPFDHGDAWAVLVGHRDTEPEPPSSHRPDLPGPLQEVILALLAKDPGNRPGSATEVRLALAAAGPPTPYSGQVPLPRVPLHRQPRPRSRGAADSAGWGLRTATPPGHAPAVGDRWADAGPGEPAGLVEPDPVDPEATEPAAPPAGCSGAAAERPGEVATLPGEQQLSPPPEPLALLSDRHSAALRLGRLGRWEEAGEAHRAVAAAREQALGPGHPDTLASHYEIAFTLGRLGRYEEALAQYGRVAEARERELGPEHADTLAARQESAYALGRLGRHFEAHQVYATVLAVRERVMGADHPDTLRCRHNLAFNLSRLGRLEDSYRMVHEVAEARAAVLGADHPDTLVTRYEVAYALGRLDRWAEALDVYRDVARDRARMLGADHPDTLAARYETGISLGRLGRSEEALELYRDLAAARTRAQGATDPETLRARHGYGVNLGRLGRWEEALAEAREVCLLRERVLGPDRPDTLVSRREAAVALGWLGRWDEALVVYRTVAESRVRVLGEDHPDSLTSRNDEAHCLEQLGRQTEAADVYRHVAALRQQRGAEGGR